MHITTINTTTTTNRCTLKNLRCTPSHCVVVVRPVRVRFVPPPRRAVPWTVPSGTKKGCVANGRVAAYDRTTHVLTASNVRYWSGDVKVARWASKTASNDDDMRRCGDSDGRGGVYNRPRMEILLVLLPDHGPFSVRYDVVGLRWGVPCPRHRLFVACRLQGVRPGQRHFATHVANLHRSRNV